MLTNYPKPKRYEEAMKLETRIKWKQGKKEEIDALVHNQTWDVVLFLVGNITLQNKWVYRLNEEHGAKGRYKAKRIVNWFVQEKDIYFNEIFSHVFRMT